MINKDIIKQRKQQYGNNFPDIAKKWSKYLNKEITPKEVAMLMALMKQVRVDMSQTEDSITDRENYLWIYENYTEYESL